MKNQKGQSLIEVLVSLGTAAIIIGAITVATISALNNAVYSKNQNLANTFAQQAIEIVRNMRDTSYPTFSELNGYYCLAKSCTTINPSGSSVNDPCGAKSVLCEQNVGGENVDTFVRQVYINPNATYCQDSTEKSTQATQVTVDVAWYDAKCGTGDVFCHHVDLSTCLSTYNAISSQ